MYKALDILVDSILVWDGTLIYFYFVKAMFVTMFRGNCGITLRNKAQKLQNRATRVLTSQTIT